MINLFLVVPLNYLPLKTYNSGRRCLEFKNLFLLLYRELANYSSLFKRFLSLDYILNISNI